MTEKAWKLCKLCKKEKPLTEYFFNSSLKKTYQSRCKKCHNIKKPKTNDQINFNVHERTNWIL